MRNYWEQVRNGLAETANVSYVKFNNWSDFGNNFSDLIDNNDLIICNWRKSESDLIRILLDRIMKTTKLTHSILFTFSDVDKYMDTICYLKSNSNIPLSRCSIVPLNFAVSKASVTNNIVENEVYGLLCGRYPQLDTPLKRLYHNTENMVDLVKSISLPHSNVAMLSDIGGSLYRIHSPDLVQRVRYYGTSETMTAFFKGLSREKCMPDESNDVNELEANSSQSVAPNLQDIELDENVSSTSPIKCGINNEPGLDASQDSCYGSQLSISQAGDCY